jgi:hypothetical protein
MATAMATARRMILPPIRTKYVCQSKECRRMVEVQTPSCDMYQILPNCPCVCGAETKKVYSEPVLMKYEVMLAGDWYDRRRSHCRSVSKRTV